MHEIVFKNGGILKDKCNSRSIFFTTTTCLLVIMVYGLINFSLSGNFLKGLLVIIIPMVTNLITEYIYYLIKKDKKSLNQLIFEDYSYLTGLLLGLLVSINTNYIALFIVTIFITIIKLFLGGMFRNLINPVVIGAVLLNIFYPIHINKLSSFNVGLLFNNEINILGGISQILIFISFVVLLINYSIKKNNGIYSLFVIVLFYLISIFLFGNNFNSLFNVLVSSNLLFCVTFLTSDNIITPLTKKANILSGVLFGILYLISLLFKINNAIYAVLVVNIFNIVLKKLEVKYNFNK